MAMVVKNNMSAVNTLNTMTKNNSALGKSIQKLSSGMKINGAADDVAGYAISEKMRVQIRSLDQANQNAQNGTSLMKVAEGAVSSTVEILKTLKEKVINSANDTNTTADRQMIQDELNQAVDQINDNASVTFNGKLLVDGSMNKKVTATTNTYVNEALSTATTATTNLTALTDRNGNSLDIKDTDEVTVSFIKNGKTETTTFSAKDAKLEDIFKNANSVSTGAFNATLGADSKIGLSGQSVQLYSADGKSVISVKAGDSGVTNGISGFSISVKDTFGNVRKSINDKLGAWSESVRAENASNDNALNLQIGTKSNQSINVGISDMRAMALGLQGADTLTNTAKTINVTTVDNANAAINVIDNAIQRALNEQTKLGSVQSRLSYTSDNLTTSSENVQAAESTIRDVDMAKEMTNFTKNNILLQASQSMLAQANQSTQGVLSLLQ